MKTKIIFENMLDERLSAIVDSFGPGIQIMQVKEVICTDDEDEEEDNEE